jgi:hypothetical protein
MQRLKRLKRPKRLNRLLAPPPPSPMHTLQCLFSHPYPVGFRAVKRAWGLNFEMSIRSENGRPVFYVRDSLLSLPCCTLCLCFLTSSCVLLCTVCFCVCFMCVCFSGCAFRELVCVCECVCARMTRLSWTTSDPADDALFVASHRRYKARM